MVENNDILVNSKQNNKFKRFFANVFGKTAGDIIFNILNYFFFIALFILCLYPFFYVLIESLKLVNTSGDVPTTYFGFDAYTLVFANESLLSSLLFSIGVTLLSTFLSVSLTVLCAYPLTRSKLKGKNFFLLFIVFSMLFSGGFIPYYLLITETLNLRGNPLVYIVVGLVSPYNIIIVKNFIKGIPEEILESSRVDGASEIRTLFQIILPLSGPIIATIGLWVAVGKWNDWMTTLYYMADGDKSMWMFQYYVQEILSTASSDNPNPDPSIVALAENVRNSAVVISVLPIILVYPFVQKYFVKGVLLGSVKG